MYRHASIDTILQYFKTDLAERIFTVILLSLKGKGKEITTHFAISCVVESCANNFSICIMISRNTKLFREITNYTILKNPISIYIY